VLKIKGANGDDQHLKYNYIKVIKARNLDNEIDIDTPDIMGVQQNEI